MVLPYILRLLCLCLASFFLMHLAAAVIAWLSAPAALRVARRANPGFAAKFLFAFRMFPSALTAFMVLGFCIPSYLWLEPAFIGEKVGAACFVAAALGAGTWILGAMRASFSLARTSQYMNTCEKQGEEIALAGEPSSVVVLKNEVPVLAMAGVLRPKLIVSRSVMHRLTLEQREAAFRHESAHRASRDNLKRFLYLLAPDAIPFVSGFRTIERHWARYTEWAADDRAVAGDSRRALSLASALVSVAKLGVNHQSHYLLSSLVNEGDDLELRVDRLLREQNYAEKPLVPLVGAVRNIALLAAACGLTVLLWPNSLSSVHRVLEKLIQ